MSHPTSDIEIWDGSTNFIAGESTPLGFYDDDLSFQEDAPKVVVQVSNIKIEVEKQCEGTCYCTASAIVERRCRAAPCDNRHRSHR